MCVTDIVQPYGECSCVWSGSHYAGVYARLPTYRKHVERQPADGEHNDNGDHHLDHLKSTIIKGETSTKRQYFFFFTFLYRTLQIIPIV